MIIYLAIFLNLVVDIIRNILLFASYIGQLIVISITALLSVILSFTRSVLIFLQIVYEDNINFFMEELPNWVFCFSDGVVNQWSNFYEYILLLSQDINSQCWVVITSMKWSIKTIFIIVSDIFCTIKTIIILLGDTFWFVVTFFPVHLPYLLKALLQAIRESIVNNAIQSYMALLKVTNFLTDVPLESFMGIMLAMVIVRLCISFRVTMQSQIISFYWLCVRKILFMYHHIHIYFTNSEVRVIPEITGANAVTRRELDNNDEIASDSLCVICQERQKCILTLPCRHVCLCSECCMQLYGYQRTCPICRTFIYHSVTIYI